MQNIKLKTEKRQRSASHRCFWVMQNMGTNVDLKELIMQSMRARYPIREKKHVK